MITKKSAVSLALFSISMLLMLAAVQFMSLFTLSEWVGVGTGGGVLLISFLIYCLVRKKPRWLSLLIIVISSLATGITISSLFAPSGHYPKLWQSALLYACLVALFYIYCLCTNLSFLRNHCNISILIYSVILLAAGILLFVFFRYAIFLLALMSLIPFIAFLISLPLKANGIDGHIGILALCSFGFLITAVIVVLLVLSDGEALNSLDGADFGGGISVSPKRKNPYDYLVK